MSLGSTSKCTSLTYSHFMYCTSVCIKVVVCHLSYSDQLTLVLLDILVPPNKFWFLHVSVQRYVEHEQ